MTIRSALAVSTFLLTLVCAGTAFAQQSNARYESSISDPNLVIPGLGSFGSSIDVGGGRMLVGDRLHFDDSNTLRGEAYLFNADTGQLLHTFDGDGLPNPGAGFATNVALDNDLALIARLTSITTEEDTFRNVPEILVYDANSGDLLRSFSDPTPQDDSVLGQVFDVLWPALDAANGLTAVGVSGALDDERGFLATGEVLVFRTGTGEHVQTLVDADWVFGDRFGGSVAVDRGRVLVGTAQNVANSRYGKAQLFDVETGAVLMAFAEPTGERPSSVQFGFRVALFDDTVVIASPGNGLNGANGLVHVFSASTGDLLGTLENPTPTGAGPFGFAIAVTENVIAVVAQGDNSNVGQLHIFDRDSLALVDSFGAPNPPQLPDGRIFGYDLAADSGVVVVAEAGAQLLSEQDLPYFDGFAHKYSVFTPQFCDVPESNFAISFIERLFEAGVTAGCGGCNYCPDDSVTRAQMAVFLLRGINGSNYGPPAASGTVFTDVSQGTFAASWIEQLAAAGITAGCGNDNYCPNGLVTRAQMAVFLLRARFGSNYSPPPATGVFTDVPPGSFAAAWIEQLAAEGITSGCGNGNYCPNDPVTRAQMAVFLVRAFEL